MDHLSFPSSEILSGICLALIGKPFVPPGPDRHLQHARSAQLCACELLYARCVLRIPDQPMVWLLARLRWSRPYWQGLIGAAVERYGLRHVHKNGHVAELLFTFGLAFVIEVVVEIIWGKSPVDYRVPRLLDFPAFTIFSTNYPVFKMFMLVSLAIFLALLIALKKTRVGLIVQAALTHPHMAGISDTGSTASSWFSLLAPRSPV